jgi:hypothetical protein
MLTDDIEGSVLEVRILEMASEPNAFEITVNGQKGKVLCSSILYNPNVRMMTLAATADILVLDFSNICVIDAGIVLDTIIPVKKELLKRGKTLVLKNTCEDVLAEIRAFIAFYREQSGTNFCILAYTERGYQLLGHAEPNLMKAFNYVLQKGSITATDLQQLANIEIHNASTRLKRLFDAGILVRERFVDRTGRYHVYALPRVS